jgi:beta-galactosidase
MKNKTMLMILVGISFALIFLSGCLQDNTASFIQKRDRSFNENWKFFRGDTAGAELPEFKDAQWRLLDLPHDWSIEDLPGEQNEDQLGPFSKSSPGNTSTGYTIGGTGWYRKHFTLENTDSAKTVILYFDGVYMESDVWINGRHIGFHPYGYTPFYYDISKYLNPAGKNNIIAVRVRNSGRNSRWYSGSGIYRPVWLTVVESVHVDIWGVSITTPEVSRDRAKIKLNVSIKNEFPGDRDLLLMITVTDPDKKMAATMEKKGIVSGRSKTDFEQNIEIKQPGLWAPNTPQLYQAEIRLLTGGNISDIYTINFGIRSIEYSSDKGFLLNNESIKLKGSCIHHDNGMLGSAAFDRAEERRVELMKDNGFNAVRTSHNPPSQAFLDACDRLGILVIDEAFDIWERPKNPQDYHRFFINYWQHDLQSMLLRDRNHPSVIMWSIGNEVNERADTSGIRIARQLINTVRALDASRPVTNAICSFWDHPGRDWSETAAAFELLDISGYNYQWREYSNDHAKYPKRIIYGSESIPGETWENWRQVETYPYVVGDFVWTGMDYLGETGIGHAVYRQKGEEDAFAMPWPWYNAWCGDIDICGNKKPQSFYRDVVWDRSKLEILVHEPVPDGKKEVISYWGWPAEYPSWNWAGEEGKPLQVSVYTTCTKVRLELNGKIVGEKTVEVDSGITVKFEVPYQPGTLKAVGLIDGKEIISKSIKTSGPPTAIRLSADRPIIRAKRNDLAYIAVEVVDSADNRVPDASIPVHLNLSGEGELLAAGNAAPDQMSSFKQLQCTTYRGRALVILRPTITPSTIKLTAEAAGLTPTSVVIQTK